MSKGKALETFRTAYLNYKKTHHYSTRKLSLQSYLKLMNGFSEFLIDCVLEGEKVYLPENLGVLQIIGKKLIPKVVNNQIEGLTINWGETQKLWKSCDECKNKKQKVYLFNEHSDGIRYRFIWSRISMLLHTKFIYTYVPNRKSKKLLFEKIHSGKEYLILEGRYSPLNYNKSNIGKYK
jgi:hypothetical protein